MHFEPTYQSPQDTLKKTLPYIVPAGRVEEFYDFSGGTTEGGEPEAVKTDTVKPKEKVAAKKLPKPEPAKQLAEVPEEAPVPDFSGFVFLKDTLRPKFELTYVNAALPEEKPEVQATYFAPAFDYAPSLFVAHELKVKNLSPVSLPVKGGEGLLFAFMAILGIFSMVKVAYYKNAKQYLSAFFNLRMNFQILREEKSVNEQLYSLLLIASVLVTSSFLLQLFRHFGISLPFLDQFVQGFLFWKIFFLALTAIGLKFLAIKVLGYVFGMGRQSSAYIFNQILFFNIFNLVLFPLSVAVQYNGLLPPQFFFLAGGFMAVMAFLFMFQRFLVLGNSEAGTSTYYIFLYLCTLEILPVVILTKLLLTATG